MHRWDDLDHVEEWWLMIRVEVSAYIQARVDHRIWMLFFISWSRLEKRFDCSFNAYLFLPMPGFSTRVRTWQWVLADVLLLLRRLFARPSTITPPICLSNAHEQGQSSYRGRVTEELCFQWKRLFLSFPVSVSLMFGCYQGKLELGKVPCPVLVTHVLVSDICRLGYSL